MSRTRKDRPYRLGGQRHPYATSETWHAWFTRDCRRKARRKAQAALKAGQEPEPRYKVESAYYD